MGCGGVGGEVVGEVLRRVLEGRALGLRSYRKVVVPEGRSRLPFWKAEADKVLKLDRR
jgi:hypothetical protein